MSDSLECSRGCKAGVVIDHAAMKKTCAECGLELGSYSIDNDTTKDFLSLVGNSLNCHSNTTETKNPSSSSDDDFLSLTLSLGNSETCLSNPVSFVTTKTKNTSSSDDDFLSLRLGFGPFCIATNKGKNTIIETMCDKLGLPESVKNQAYDNFKKVENEHRGKRKDIAFPACIYIACRQNNIALSIDEIESVANGPKASIIYKKARSLAAILGLEPYLMMHIRADEFTKRFCSTLQMDSQVVKAAQEAAGNSTRVVDNRTPLAVAAVIIFVVARISYEKKLFKDIMEATKVPELTMNEIYKVLYPHMWKIVPKWFAEAKDMKRLHRP
ncbi:hypothetical protein AALP_AA5G217800 [Arabis alpina]|uniref:Transcription factor TFIIB cyclin-like domain-containing protein n=1 Tax=Arabis alpina TaxID=50452 RepID=A0A087GYM1_ARAAL|nr:hypothetical protein AALP_AA5G217800 [Arabis alpina]